MDKEILFQHLEELLKNIGDKESKKTLKATISYTTGEQEVFDVSEVFWAKMMVATKNRDKYLYYQQHLINLDHVVKVRYEKINTND